MGGLGAGSTGSGGARARLWAAAFAFVASVASASLAAFFRLITSAKGSTSTPLSLLLSDADEETGRVGEGRVTAGAATLTCCTADDPPPTGAPATFFLFMISANDRTSTLV